MEPEAPGVRRRKRTRQTWRKGIRPAKPLPACSEGCGRTAVRSAANVLLPTCGAQICKKSRARRKAAEGMAERRRYRTSRGRCRCGRRRRAGFATCWRCATAEVARWARRAAKAAAERGALAAADGAITAAMTAALEAADVAVRRRPLRKAARATLAAEL